MVNITKTIVLFLYNFIFNANLTNFSIIVNTIDLNCL